VHSADNLATNEPLPDRVMPRCSGPVRQPVQSSQWAALDNPGAGVGYVYYAENPEEATAQITQLCTRLKDGFE
jgi:hypothetical protein